jgi:hypothetical protein
MWPIFLAVLAMLSFEAGCSPSFPDTCAKVAIESAGVYCLVRTRVVVASSIGPFGSDVAYVDISPPASLIGEFDDVSRITLMPDINPTTEPTCGVSKDGGRYCAMSVKGKMLTVIVHFRSAAAARIDERTKLVAKDVGETENVIKQWYKR